MSPANDVRLFSDQEIDRILDQANLPDIVANVGVHLKRAGRRLRGLCPFHTERTPSFYVTERGGRWRYRCFGCGASGDAIGFLRAHHGLSFPDAVRELGGEVDPATSAERAEAIARRREERAAELAVREAAEGQAKRAKARDLWRAAVPLLPGDPVWAYLTARGIAPETWPHGLPPTLRCNRLLDYWWQPEEAPTEDRAPRPGGEGSAISLGRFPAMVSAIQAANGRLIGVHLTYLQPDGAGKAQLHDPETGEILPSKKIRGETWGGAIRLARPGPETGWRLGLSEGIETGASVMIAMEGALPVWAAVSLGNLAGGQDGQGGRHPDPRRVDWRGRRLRLPSAVPDPERPGIVAPDEVEDVVILADGDSKDPASFEATLARAVARHRKRPNGRLRTCRVARPPRGMDFNDLLRGDAA